MTRPETEEVTSAEVLSRLDENLEILFYPSSGWKIENVLDLPYNVFIFADKEPRTAEAKRRFFRRLSSRIGGCTKISMASDNVFFQKGSKLGIVVFDDNNVVLKRIQNAGRNINCLVGICDGCVEGGNDECLNDIPFMAKVMRLVPKEGMEYFTGHSYLLSNTKPNSAHLEVNPRQEVIFCSMRLMRTGITYRELSSHSWGPINEYKVTPHVSSIREWQVKALRLTLEHDTIANHLDELDGVYVSCRCRRLFTTSNSGALPRFRGAPDYYFMPSLREGWSTGDSLRSLLSLCENKQWKIVGTTAFGEGDHHEMMGILSSRQGRYPESIRIFHFDKDDFADIDQLFHKAK